MGKRDKKKSRAQQKGKRVTVPAPSPVIAPEQSSCLGDATIDHGGVKVVKERKPCPHIQKGFNLTNLTEKLGSPDSLRCEDCREGAADKRGAKSRGRHVKKKGDSKSESKAIWVCLDCGHFACGGVGFPTTEQSHAVRHAKQTRHPLVIQWEKPQLRWCFQCSSLIPVETTEESGEKKDVFLDVVKLIKTQISAKSSEDVEELWFGSGSILSETKVEGTSIVSRSLEAGGGYIVRGLVNLGNTCFFNSVMQNLLAMDKLREYFYNQDASYGSLTIALKKLFHETMETGGHKNVINPRAFFGCICSKAPQFRGYQQQDSHELLRCLLDGLSSEELAVRKRVNASREDGNSLKEGPIFVDALFGGRISSTVSCTQCGHSSTVYEPYLDLSLPVPMKKPATKKVQPVSRNKKTKLPPKRGGKVRAQANKETDTVPAQSISSCSESPCQTQSTPDAEYMMASSGDVAGTESVCSVGVADNNGLTSQHLSNVPNTDNEQVADATVEQTATSFDEFSWMDYVEPETTSDEQDFAPQHNDVSACQYSENTNLNNGLMESTELHSVGGGPTLKLDSSSVNPSEEEVPLQIKSSEVLLLPYKEESYTDGAIVKGEDEASSSAAGCRQEEEDFDGFGDLFNEPEESSAPVAGPSLRTGFAAAHSSESDPDEVDNSDSAVSVESCLAHFIKPELLSKDNAWECENCSKVLLRQRLETKKKQAVTVPNAITYGGEGLVSDNGKMDSSSESCRETEGGQTDKLKLNDIQSKERKDEDEMTADTMQPSNSSTVYKSLEQESLSCPAVSSSSVDEPSSSGYATARDQLGDSQSSVNCVAEEDGDDGEERTSRKVKVKRDATKRVHVDKAPPILTIHLKRFSQDVRGRLSKLNGHVKFGDMLDLRPYMDARCRDREEYVYRLLGVVEHSGSMRSGHYVAYVRGGSRSSKGKTEGEKGSAVWYHASDAYVREVSLDEVLRSEAYILFYEKI
ncbi:Ubiquitin carboxyl-terminal hydrolase 2 [Euphorbia peplus]|nr:Ubiquitin carboxyl-terminal hydrolase 2 [Euphorbia peplus]